MKVVYVSGGMTGYENLNKEKFNKKTEELRNIGHFVINPVEISIDVEKRCFENEAKREDYLKEDIKYLIICDTIYFLEGWSKSEGAVLEYIIAKALNLHIVFEDVFEMAPDIELMISAICKMYNKEYNEQLHGIIKKDLKNLLKQY